MTIFAVVRSFEKNKPFTESEAWALYRLAAFSEAIGWSLLIGGIILKQFVYHGNDTPVLIAGQIHGTIFLVYMVAAVGLYPSLGWSRWRALFALAAGVPPYGSLVFELWASYRRQQQHIGIYGRSVAYHIACAAL